MLRKVVFLIHPLSKGILRVFFHIINFSFSSKLIEKNENNMGADANCTSSHSILSQNQKRKTNCSAHRYPSS